ncbi:hypothetical protein PoMZ_05522 [Pyricularia oryzae]|uniref:Uncharacterized protein n=1 Tax=Pyricularia oryzae TaxID=318829 RepID=A0A4P7NNV8_PYROR|nr:hypothetical protein PoMZ_05522 [Pyricularia oryzae]
MHNCPDARSWRWLRPPIRPQLFSPMWCRVALQPEEGRAPTSYLATLAVWKPSIGQLWPYRADGLQKAHPLATPKKKEQREHFVLNHDLTDM